MVEKRINPEALIRPQIRSLKAYESKTVPNCVRLDANENPFPWPTGMKEKLFKEKFSLNRYPDGEALELKKALSRYTGIPAEGILAGNGSDELIQLIMTTFGGEKKAVVLHPPTFSMYNAAAKVTGTDIIEVPLLVGTDSEIRLDVERILETAARPEAHIIILCNPNNPTGSLYPREDIMKIVIESGKIVIVDEAYTEFSGETVIDQIQNYSNLIVMRTFSKAFAMAALRLGYLLGQSSTIELLNRARQPFNVNALTQRTGVIALEYLEEYNEQTRSLIEETQKIYKSLKAIAGVRVFPTRSNFVLFQPENPEAVYQELINQGFLIRNMGNLLGIGKALRLSAGLPEENKRVIEILKTILA
jgi:histidinol-phosphate aminotransferase